MGEPGHEPVDGGARDAGPRDAAPDGPDASPGPRFVQIAQIGPPGARREDAFGSSVALDGDVLAVGMPGEDSAAQGIDGDEDDERALNAGAVYVFRRTGTGWDREAYLKASNARAAGDNPVSHYHGFGSLVAVSGDTLAVSAPNESGGARGVNGDQDNEDAPRSGAVYVFRRSDAGWHQEAYLKPSDAHTDQHFGAAAMALDGNTLAVVATVYPWSDEILASGSPRGAGSSSEARDAIGIQCARPRGPDTVYVFRRNGTDWQEEARIPLPPGFWYDPYWGLTGTLELSGDTLAIGAPGESRETGGVYVFRRTGTMWQQEAHVQVPEAGAPSHVHFGAALALEGDLLAVGAPGGSDSAVYLFRRSGAAWHHEGGVTAAVDGAWSGFGHAVALDGDDLAVAARPPEVYPPPPGLGVVYMFRRDGTGWRQEGVVTGVPAREGYGVSGTIALSGDDLVIGAPQADTGADWSGALHAFRRVGPGAAPVDAGPGGPDAAPGDTAPGVIVRGIAAGVRGPVALVLQYRDGSELLEITQDGAFAFQTQLRFTGYTVRLADADAPCVLRNQAGSSVAWDAPRVELQCASLGSVLVGDSLVALGPETSDYTVDLLLSRESATVTATVARPGDTLAIDGVSVPSGTPSAPLALDLGDNVVDIVVENALGWQRTYRLTIRRAAEIAQHAYAKGATAGPRKRFGTALALSGDTLAVGATGEDSDSGAVYVFRRSGTSWQQEALLQASNAESYDHFGASVALSGDTLAVGAPQEDSAALGIGGDQGNHGIWENGAVYVFRREGTAWQQEAYVKSSRLAYRQFFGDLVALSGDTLAVGATSPPVPPDTYQPPRIPAVHVFRRTQTGWQAEAVVDVGADLLLASMALADDTLAFGGAGRAYVFRRSGTSWQQEAALASTCESGDGFGASVALSGDTLAIGAAVEDSAARGVGGSPSGDGVPDSGAVYVYRRGEAGWQQEAYVKASNTGYLDHFGASVALSGALLAVGASGEASAATGVNGDQADNRARTSGAVYVYRRSETGWQQVAYVKASNTGVLDGFGERVVLAGDVLAVGAPFEDSAATGINGDQADDGQESSGAAYVFHHLWQ
jgi:hypothetical protein